MLKYKTGLPDGSVGKESACNAGKQEMQVWSLGGEDPLEEEMGTHSSILLENSPGKFQGQRSLVDYSPWGCKELDMTEYMTHEVWEPQPQCDLRRRVLRIAEPQSTEELLQQNQPALSPRYLNAQAIIAC